MFLSCPDDIEQCEKIRTELEDIEDTREKKIVEMISNITSTT